MFKVFLAYRSRSRCAVLAAFSLSAKRFDILWHILSCFSARCDFKEWLFELLSPCCQFRPSALSGKLVVSSHRTVSYTVFIFAFYTVSFRDCCVWTSQEISHFLNTQSSNYHRLVYIAGLSFVTLFTLKAFAARCKSRKFYVIRDLKRKYCNREIYH